MEKSHRGMREDDRRKLNYEDKFEEFEHRANRISQFLGL